MNQNEKNRSGKKKPLNFALIFASGYELYSEAKSEQGSTLTTRKYARIVQKICINMGFKDFKIQNTMASCGVQFPISLEDLVTSHDAFSTYEPELSPSLIYLMKKPKVVFFIFVYRRKIVITGAKAREL